MNITRRNAMRSLAAAAAAAQSLSAQSGPEYMPGPFKNTRDSLKNYTAPEWFRDAKFGIWAHWGPQSAPEYGDWYARNMYIQGHKQYEYHCKKYGHPTKFGFKDVIPTWKAEKFDPEALMALYKKAGAKYFVSMGVHHDNFDMWNSKHNPWNATRMGIKRDVVGEFAKAARKNGMKFGVSEHLGVVYNWYQSAHGSDKEGPYKGIPYDGADPKNQSLYGVTHEPAKNLWDQSNVPLSWKQHWYARIKDVLDQYEPDLLYTDGPIFFEEWGLAITAHLYNMSAKKHGGKAETVYANKGKQDCVNGTCVLDLERGVVDKVWPEPWQTDTCIGTWHYNVEAKYKTPKIVTDMLVDIVSRNGNLLLNFPLPSSGALDPDELKILDGITRWMAVNSEAIYSTRPWTTYGSGPSTGNTAAGRSGASDHHVAEAFNERNRKDLSAADVRYTKKGNTLYAFSMGTDAAEAVFPELAQGKAKVKNVSVLGLKGKVQWSQDAAGLKVKLPSQKPSEFSVVCKVESA